VTGARITAGGRELAAVVAALQAQTLEEAWQADEIESVLSLPGAGVLLATAGGQSDEPVGFAFYLLTGEDCELLSIGVVPGRRRNGIGTEMLSAVVDRARAAGVSRIVLEVAEDNEVARALYAAWGFAKIGRRARYYGRRGGAHRDALVLQRPVGANAATDAAASHAAIRPRR